MVSSDDEKENNTEDTGDTEVVLDLSGHKLTKLEKAPSNRAFATALVLDDNNLQYLHNLDSYGELQRISLSNNKIMRMYWFARMYSLRILNLPGNNIANIEGLKELHHLVHLNLAGNGIKNMDGVSQCYKLQHLNLSGNSISHVSDLSTLRNLKELFLHRNKLGCLTRCNKYLPASLVILTFSDNQLEDLNYLCNLSHLHQLEQFTILNNPCLQPYQPTDESGLPSGAPLAFDYRPFVINWCLNLKVLDGYKVTPMESLKGEWLYSQGRGRSFQLGEHGPLVQYLSGICLAGGGWGGAALPQHDLKLVKILQLAKQHQQDLRQKENCPAPQNSEVSRLPPTSGAPVAGMTGSMSQHSSPATHRRNLHSRPPPHHRRHTAPTRICPPDRRTLNRVNYYQGTQQPQPPPSKQKYQVELSSTLYGGGLKTPDTPGNLMTQSMDPSMLLDDLRDSSSVCNSTGAAVEHSQPGRPSSAMTRSLGPEQLQEALSSPRNASSGRNQHSRSRRSSRQSSEPVSYDDSAFPANMTQSLGPEQLAQQLADCGPESNGYSSYSFDAVNGGNDYGLTNGTTEGHSRPTCLFQDDTNTGHGDMMSPEHRAVSTSNVRPASASSFGYHQNSHHQSQYGGGTGHQNSHHQSQYGGAGHQQRHISAHQASHHAAEARSIRGAAQARHNSRLAMGPGRYATCLTSSPKLGASGRRGATNNVAGRSSSADGRPPLARPVPSPKPAPRYARSPHHNSIDDRSAAAVNSDSDLSDGEASSHRPSSASFSIRDKKRCITPPPQTILRGKSAPSSSEPQQKRPPPPAAAAGGVAASYNPHKYNKVEDNKRTNTAGDVKPTRRSMSVTEAVITLQKYWRGFITRHRDPAAVAVRAELRHARTEDHVKVLQQKLQRAEEALERERRLRHLQLEAIRALWKQVGRLQAGRTTPSSTPVSTPLTPSTPQQDGLSKGPGSSKRSGSSHSDDTVKELTQFCEQLQGQVVNLQDSLSMVTQVMNAFCQLPGSQALLLSNTSANGTPSSLHLTPNASALADALNRPGANSDGSGSGPPLTESFSSLTSSITALTSNITSHRANEAASCDGQSSTTSGVVVGNTAEEESCRGKATAGGAATVPVVQCGEAAGLLNVATAEGVNGEQNSTAQDVSTLSHDASTLSHDDHELSDNSQSSGSLSGGSHSASRPQVSRGPPAGGAPSSVGPQRPSSLPVCRDVPQHRA